MLGQRKRRSAVFFIELSRKIVQQIKLTSRCPRVVQIGRIPYPLPRQPGLLFHVADSVTRYFLFDTFLFDFFSSSALFCPSEAPKRLQSTRRLFLLRK